MIRPTWEQWGIIFNFFAGIFLSLEFIFPKSWINKANNSADAIIFYIEIEFSSFPKGFYLIGPIYIIVISIVFYLIHQAVLWLSGIVDFNNSIYIMILNIILLLEWGFLIIFVAIPLLAPIGLIILKVLNASPKGAIGTIGIFLYLLGNALQLWATFK